MINVENFNFFILTGTFGSGKSTLIEQLVRRGIPAVSEPARAILAAERAKNGDGVPEKKPQLFTDLLLEHAIKQYQLHSNQQSPIIFDRGIADNIAYRKLFNLNQTSAIQAATHYRYNPQVFFLPSWEAIFENDDERKISFAEAKKFGDQLRKIYEDLNYQLIDVPQDTPNARADFIIKQIN